MWFAIPLWDAFCFTKIRDLTYDKIGWRTYDNTLNFEDYNA